MPVRGGKPAAAKFLTYAGVGGVCSLLSIGVLWLLTSVFSAHYLVSTLVAFCTVTPVGFGLQKVVTFRTPASTTHVEWPRYVATMGSTLAANLALMYLLVSLLGLWYLAASVVVTVLLLGCNFLVNSEWTFSRR